MESLSFYNNLLTSNLDKNIVIQSNYIGWSIALAYVAFTKLVGPSIMRNRRAFSLQQLMIFYNMTVSGINVYLAFNITRIMIKEWPFRCEATCTMHKKEYHWIAWLTFFTKFAELFDTVIFVLRKKFQQVSFLHVYHHTTVFTLYWLCLKYKLGGFYLFLIGSINCSIHVLLYLYYGLSVLGPGVRNYLWWKKYLTSLQIAQFVVLMLYMGFNFLTGCERVTFFGQAVFLGLLLVTVLFMNFYYRTYNVKEK